MTFPVRFNKRDKIEVTLFPFNALDKLSVAESISSLKPSAFSPAPPEFIINETSFNTSEPLSNAPFNIDVPVSLL